MTTDLSIVRVSVSGLFDRFEHDLKFRSDEPITIIIGPNGFGKTMILRMLHALFNQPLKVLARFPFQTLTVYFNDGTRIIAMRRKGENTRSIENIELIYSNGSTVEPRYVTKSNFDPSDLAIPIAAIEDVIPELDQVGSKEWRNLRTGEILEIDEVIEDFGPRLPWEGETPELQKPDWLFDIRKKIPVRLVDTERLTQAPHFGHQRIHPRWHYEQIHANRTVLRYSDELADRVKKTLSDYGTRAQSLDRTFPVRLVEEPSQTDVTMEQLRKELAEVELKRARLVDAGLLVQEEEGPDVPPLEEVDESRRGVLAVYARDAKEKLSIFDDLFLRIDAFRRISNEKLLYKEVTVGSHGISVQNSDGSRIDLDVLSSGEQHELVILYELLFRIPNNSLIMLDEPELSLHVAWQDMFLSDLSHMAKISRFRALLATHSPQIIGDRWDLAVELKGPKDHEK